MSLAARTSWTCTARFSFTAPSWTQSFRGKAPPWASSSVVGRSTASDATATLKGCRPKKPHSALSTKGRAAPPSDGPPLWAPEPALEAEATRSKSIVPSSFILSAAASTASSLAASPGLEKGTSAYPAFSLAAASPPPCCSTACCSAACWALAPSTHQRRLRKLAPKGVVTGLALSLALWSYSTRSSSECPGRTSTLTQSAPKGWE
mmetsp:Transcript_57069/g.129291  ORF Transcript_57069/g.129291 Transcript_57069/m.129291 type:complete len:206 (-) Transcript_57069:1567-2184(-)